MAILGKTSITELNLITPLSNANLENSKITINGTAVPLGGTYNLIDSATASSLLYTLGQGDSNPSDNTWYITSISSGTGTTFYKRSHSYLYGYLKDKFDNVYQPKGSYLTTNGTAADSNKLGGVAASGYKTTQSAVADPTASTATTTTFIDTISQNTNGVITVTKKTLPITNTWNGTSTTTILSQKGAKSLYDSVVSATKTNADNAAASATAAAASATSASTAATTATNKATAAAASATSAKTSETNAASSATAAASSATSASTAASTATSKANAASTSATNAKTSETNAASSASAASSSATAAAASATQVANSLSNYYTKTDFPKDHSTTANTYGLATSGSSAKYGHVKLVGGDVSGQTYSNGVAAAAAHTHGNYATQAWVNGKNYITSAATVADSNKLGGTAASGYLTTGGTAADSNKLGGVAASGYLTTGGTAASANKVVSAITLTYGSTIDKTGSTTYSGNSKPTVYIPTKTSEIKNDSGFVTNDSNLAWGTTAINGGISPVDAALSNIHSANRLAFSNASGITIEYSRNAGSSWTTYSTTDAAKIQLVSGIGSDFSIGGRSSTANTVNDQLRVTFNANNMGIYTRPRKLLLNITTNYAKGSKVKIELATVGTPTTFTTLGTYDISGWSGWNSIPLGTLGTFGGSSTQTTNQGVIRMTFSITGAASGQNNGLTLHDVALHGDTYWTYPSMLAKTGHLYDYDANKNAIFPGVITATTFKKSDGTEVSYTNHNHDNVYLKTGGTATNSSSLGGVAASSYALKTDLPGVFTGATSTTDGKAGLVKAPTKGQLNSFLKGDGSWGVPTNTVCTAGAFNSAEKLYLIGAPGQTDNQLAGIVTNSNSSVYMEDGTLYADKIHVNKITMIGEVYDFQISDGNHLGTRLEIAGGQAGSTNSNSKLYLIGAAYQTEQCDTNSNSKVYMQAGKLYANGSEVGTMETINNTVSALTASNVSLDARISAIENGGAGGSVSVMAGSGTTYLVGTSSSAPNQTLSEAVFNPSVYIQSGQCYATAFYQTSDETLKDFYEEIGVDFDELKSIPKKYFSWKDRRKDGIDIGTSAQALQKVYPELVSEGDDGLTVDYARLSVVALKAIDKLHEENEMLKEMLAKMDERLSKLENEK